MVESVLVIALVVCAYMASRSTRLLVSALWLAGSSALVALALYWLGAAQVAVIELSVGAGLVTVLFVFAIGIAGDDALSAPSRVPRWLAALLVLLALFLLAWFNLPVFGIQLPPPLPNPGATSFAAVLWQQRGLDVLVQVLLIFCGVIGALGLIGDTSELKVQAADLGLGEIEKSDISNLQPEIKTGVRP